MSKTQYAEEGKEVGSLELGQSTSPLDIETGSSHSIHGKLNKFARILRMEETGYEYVPPEKRTGHSTLDAGTMWFSANLNVSSLALGALGVSIFGVGFVDGFLSILFFNALAIIPVCYFSIFGSQLGLRQMIILRYSFGTFGTPILAALNVLACVGWSASNAIVGAQILKAISGQMPIWAGILLITVLTGLITIFGYKLVHIYEKWSWLPSLICFFVIIAGIAQSGDFTNIPMSTGVIEAGAVLSFGASLFGFGIGWAPYAADYQVYQKPTVNKLRVFVSTYLGLFVSLVFSETIGLAAGTLLKAESTTKYADAYDANSIGGLVGEILSRYGNGSKVVLVLLALSVIANNVPNNYSGALSIQALWSKLAIIPRWLWTGIMTAVIIAVGIPASSHFALFFEHLLLVLAYYIVAMSVIVAEEHLIFRKNSFANYDCLSWNTFVNLPIGLGAIFALACAVAGMVLGMVQVYWTGPAGGAIGPFGGDIGFELSAAFAAIVFPIARSIELKFESRLQQKIYGPSGFLNFKS
ncbi:Purine-cytosine permease fcy21 [Savitreella phatthalungensis]